MLKLTVSDRWNVFQDPSLLLLHFISLDDGNDHSFNQFVLGWSHTYRFFFIFFSFLLFGGIITMRVELYQVSVCHVMFTYEQKSLQIVVNARNTFFVFENFISMVLFFFFFIAGTSSSWLQHRESLEFISTHCQFFYISGFQF